MADQVKNVKLTPNQQKETYMQWAKRQYRKQYEKWMPWIEDQFLRFFTKDNKASYATKSSFLLSFPPNRVDNLYIAVRAVADKS